MKHRIIEDEVEVLGISFKMWVLANYKTLWHQLSDETLWEAIDMWYKFT